ncbi:MAG TPA: hypothetical protein VGG34_06695 [Opitutaceae bacterium]
MLRTIALAIWALASLSCRGQDAGTALAGTLDGGVYTSPTGAFKMQVPVLAALGGVVHDTDNVVTFRDGYGLQISVGAFAHDATQKWELSTRGTKDYLIYFFGTYVLPDFRRFCPATRIESAGYAPDLMDGCLFTYILMPGGTMFESPPVFGQGFPAIPPVAKRGNMVFVRNGFTFVISSELSERVTEGSHYSMTTAQENALLRSRLVDVAKKMVFLAPVQQK